MSNENIENNDMLDEDTRDELIAKFQEITHSENTDECMQFLRVSNWDLEEAIQLYFGSHQGATPTPSIVETNPMVHIPHNIGGPITMPEDDDEALVRAHIEEERRMLEQLRQNHFGERDLQITGQNLAQESLQHLRHTDPMESRRMLIFNIEYKGNKCTLHVPDTEKVSSLKNLCLENFNVPIEYQEIRGWKERESRAQNDDVTLRELQLPRETTLYLINKDPTVGLAQSSATIPDSESLEIFVIHRRANNEFKEYKLNFDSDKKFIELKRAAHKLTGHIPGDQKWHLQLNSSGIFDASFSNLVCISDLFDDANSIRELKQFLYNEMNLSAQVKFRIVFTVESESHLSVNVGASTSSAANQATNDEFIDFEESSFHDEDADSELFAHEAPITRNKSALIPEGVEDEREATRCFDAEFEKRYGALKPLFFVGSLEDAFKEALLCSARDRKLLGIYLHSDNTVYCNIFASTVLCDEAVVRFLASNFTVWPWDLTREKNEKKFKDECANFLGSVAASTISKHKSKLPVFLVVTRMRSNNEIVAIIEGDATKDSMLLNLMHAYEMFEEQRSKDMVDEHSREEREKIKREQDFAYQMSLNEDKIKKQKQADEIEKQRLEQERVMRLEMEFEARKVEFGSKIPAEPREDMDKSLVTTIRLKQPDGEIVQRRFLISEPLSALFYFAGSLGYFEDKFKLLSSWPRRDLMQLPADSTLQQLKLFPQETLMVEER